jgi:hypothetical protein
MKVISPEYHDFLPLFLVEESQWILPKCPDIDHQINYKPDLQPLFRPLYELLKAALKAQKE